MPDDKVNEYEDALREAEAAVEKAGRTICSATGEAAGEARGRIYKLLEGIQEAIHASYKLYED